MSGFFGSSLVSLSGAAGQVVGGVASDRMAARGGPHRRMWLQAVLILCAAPMLLAFVLITLQVRSLFDPESMAAPDAGFMERAEHAGVIGAGCAGTCQHERGSSLGRIGFGRR